VAVRPAALVSDVNALEACTRNALYKLTTFTFYFLHTLPVSSDAVSKPITLHF